MSKNRQLGWRALDMLVAVAVCIFSIWKINNGHSGLLDSILWVLMGGLAMVGIFSLTIAIAGWCNCDIFNLLAKRRRRRKKGQPAPTLPDRDFDQL